MIQVKRVTVTLMRGGKIQVMLAAHNERREILHASTDLTNGGDVAKAVHGLTDALVADPITQSFKWEDLQGLVKELRS